MMNNNTASVGRSYFYPNGITPELYPLTAERMPIRKRAMAIAELRRYINNYRATFLGYQSTAILNEKTDTDTTSDLSFLLDTAINNIGDSFPNPQLTDPANSSQLADGYFSLNAKWVERAVLDYFAERWHAGSPRRVEEDKTENWEKTYWGYVLSMGCTEGNLMALRSARDYLKGRQLLFDGSGSDSGARLHYEDCDGKLQNEFNPVTTAVNHKFQFFEKNFVKLQIVISRYRKVRIE